jgi:hypothetical protein
MAKQHGRRTTDSNDLSASFAKRSDWTGAEDGSPSDDATGDICTHSTVKCWKWFGHVFFCFPSDR